MEILMVFGLTVGELVTMSTFLALLIGGVVQINVKLKKNEESINLVQLMADEKIDALKESTHMEIEAVMKSTDLRIIALDAGRKQNADNIETMRKENREDHIAIRKDNMAIMAMLNEIISGKIHVTEKSIPSEDKKIAK